MHAEAGVFAAGVAGGAFAAAGGARVDPHGQVQIDALGKVGDQPELGHGADVVLEAGADHLLQFGALISGGDLLGGQHHAAVGNPGGMGAGRFLQRRAVQVQSLSRDDPQDGAVRVGLHGVAHMQAVGIGHVQQLPAAVLDVFLVMQVDRRAPLSGRFSG